MPRKSAAALSVVAGTIDGRPQPPEDLTEVQKDIWRRTVGSEPADFFKTAALQQLLKEYCRHIETAHVLARQIERFRDEWLLGIDGVQRYDLLLKMRERETRAIMAAATKLRLTNQSRYVPHAAATATKSVPSAKPWERHA